jgi:hypothetical protein
MDAATTASAFDAAAPRDQMAPPALEDLVALVEFGGRIRRRLADIQDDENLPGIILVIFFVPGLFGIMWYMLGCKPHQVVPS